MKALLCSNFGPIENLKVKEVKIKEPGDDEVQIKVTACSINFPDLLIIENKYQFEPELPFSPGGELSGKIIGLGKNVKNFKINDRVFALSGWGGLAEIANVNENRVFNLPNEMDYVTGASLMYNFATSLYALKNKANLKKEETILILGASGGVGLAAIELAKNIGAKVIAAASNNKKLEVCKQKGADFLINYSEDDLRQKINEITNDKGVDVVFDPLGSSFSEQALRSLKWNGRFLVVGFAAGEIPKVSLNIALLKGISIEGVFWGRFAKEEPKNNYLNMLELFQLFKSGKISVHIYKYYSLEKADKALLDLKNRKVIGKAVVILDPLIKEKNDIENDPKLPYLVGIKTVFSENSQIYNFVGNDFLPSNYLKITQKMINDFAKITKDDQWIHINEEKAAESNFGGTIAHGFLTMSLLPKMLSEVYEIKNCTMGVNYGVDNLRFLKPIKSNSYIQLFSKLIDARPISNNAIKITISAVIKIKGDDKPACIANCISLAYF